MIIKSEHACFGGVQGFYEHDSALGPMRFGVFMPPKKPCKAVYVLAGLECNEQTFAMKAGAQRVAAELGLALVTADTSTRALRVNGDDASWDFGQSASFYVDASQQPWATAYKMKTYVVQELRAAVEAAFSVSKTERGIMGHSMGGHGALTLGLSFPEVYASVSAIAPICAPSRVPWGQKAFGHLLAPDEWATADATALVQAGKRSSAIRIDQGDRDKFLQTQLLPEVFADACKATGQPLQLEMHSGYDHGYYFISSIIAEQLRHHSH